MACSGCTKVRTDLGNAIRAGKVKPAIKIAARGAQLLLANAASQATRIGRPPAIARNHQRRGR